MDDILLRMLEVSAVSSAVILAVFIFRAFLGKRVKPGVLGLLWALVLLRLCLPFTFESPVHMPRLLPQQQETAQAQPDNTSLPVTADTSDNAYNAETALTADNAFNNITGGLPGSDDAVSYNLPYTGFRSTPPADTADDPAPVQQPAAGGPSFGWLTLAAYAWIAGAAAILLSAVFKGVIFGRKLKQCGGYEEADRMVEEIRVEQNIKRKVSVRVCGNIVAPALFGLLRPKLLLPESCRNIGCETLRCILTHELCHVKRLDILKSYIWLAAKAVHWFNPLVWLAYGAFKDDIELCCDGMVLRLIGADNRFMYSLSLIDVFRSYRNALPSAVPLFEKEPKLSERVMRMVKPKKRSKAAAVLSVLLALVIAIAGFTTACAPAVQTAAATNTPQQTTAEQPTAQPASANTPSPAAVPTPEPYTVSQWTETASSGKITIDVNAQVITPNVSSFQQYAVKNNPISQDTVDKLKAYFFGDTPIYEYTNRMSMEDDLKSCTAQYEAMQDGTYKFNDGEDKKKLMASDKLHIDAIKRLIKKEPDTGLVPLDTNLSTNKDYNIQGITEAGDKIYIYTGLSCIYLKKHDPHLEMTVNNEYIGPLTPATITEQEAIAKAQEFLDKLGLADFKFYYDDSRKIGGNQSFIYGDHPSNPYIYGLEFTRVVNGIQLAGGFSRPDIDDSDNKTMNKFRNNFIEETITIQVNDSGIQGFNWRDSLSTELSNGNTQLMDVEKIKQIAVDKLLDKYKNYIGDQDSDTFRLDNKTLHVKSMKLEYARVPVNGDYDNPYLVPVWNVYATNTVSAWYKENGKEVYHVSNDLFMPIEITINALDGSVIGTQSEPNY